MQRYFKFNNSLYIYKQTMKFGSYSIQSFHLTALSLPFICFAESILVFETCKQTNLMCRMTNPPEQGLVCECARAPFLITSTHNFKYVHLTGSSIIWIRTGCFVLSFFFFFFRIYTLIILYSRLVFVNMH